MYKVETAVSKKVQSPTIWEMFCVCVYPYDHFHTRLYLFLLLALLFLTITIQVNKFLCLNYKMAANGSKTVRKYFHWLISFVSVTPLFLSSLTKSQGLNCFSTVTWITTRVSTNTRSIIAILWYLYTPKIQMIRVNVTFLLFVSVLNKVDMNLRPIYVDIL